MCKPGLYCSNSKCVVERLIGSSCSSNAECTRNSFGSVKCVSGQCQIVKGPMETCSDNSQCFSGKCVDKKCSKTTIPRETLPTKTIYCSRYLNHLQTVKGCMHKHCGNSGSLFGHFLEGPGSCAVARCHLSIKKLTDAAFDEFGVRFGNKGKAVHVSTKRFLETTSVAAVQGCSITSSLISAELGPTGSDLTLAFSNPLATSTFSTTDPSLVFTNATSFGTGATISWVAADTFRVLFGAGRTVLPGDTLGFIASALPVDPSCGNFINGTMKVGGANLRTTFGIQIVGPNKLSPSNCPSGLALSALTESGMFTYDWSLDTSAQYVQSAAISTYLSGLAATTSSILISNTTILSLPVGTLNFWLSVHDRFGVTVKTNYLVEISQSGFAPLCQWANYPTSNTWFVGQSNMLTASVVPKCSPAGSSVVVSGSSFTGSAAPTLQGQSVVFAPNTLTDGNVVTIRLDFSIQSNLVEVGNCTLIANVTGARLPPIAVIAGGNSRSLDNSNSGKITLDGSGSSDPNGGSLSATYGWDVCQFDLNSGLCDKSLGLVAWPGVSSASAAVVTLTPSSTPAGLGKFRFTLAYKIGGKNATAQQVVTIRDATTVAGVVSLASIQPNGFIGFTASFANPTWSFQLVTGAMTITPINGYTVAKFYLLVDRSSITVGGVIRISALDPVSGKSASLDYSVSKDIVPFGGSLSIVDSNGVSIGASSISSSQTYTLAAVGWSGAADIYYEFATSVAGFQALSTKSTISFAPAAVAVDTPITINVRIAILSPTFGDYSSITTSITVTVQAYSLPTGLNYVSATQNTIQLALSAIGSGDNGAGLTSANLATSILSLAPVSERTSTFVDAVTKISTALVSIPVTTITSSDSRDFVTGMISSLTAVLPPTLTQAHTNFATSLKTLLSVIFPITQFKADTTSSILAALTSAVQSTTITSSDLSASDATAVNAIVANIKSVNTGLARSFAVTYTNFTGPYVYTYGNTSIAVHKWAGAVPTGDYPALPGKLILQAPNGMSGANGIDFMDFYVVRYGNNVDINAVAPSNNTMSSSSVVVEVWNSQTRTQLRIDGSTLFNLKFLGSFTKSETCLYLNTATNTWANDGVVAADVQPTYVTCQVSHLTQFASFSTPLIAGPSGPNNDLYYLFFLLLLIPIAIAIIVVVIFLVMFITNKAKKGELKFLKLPQRNNELRTGATVGLEDLGI
jgi:hypothetical protein